MMCKSKLAIVIPYYKNDFLEYTLESLSRQTIKSFTVYIGDDNSPYPIHSILDKYNDKLDIRYHRFEDNLGGKSLVNQWERCIDLSDEEWIWLFSDDDVIESDAVQVFYDNNSDQSLFYKFHTQVIDVDGKLHPDYIKFDALNDTKGSILSADFIRNRLACNGYRSYAVEYIFHRSLFERFKFVDFPLAWASDDATWFLYSLHNNKQITVLESKVYWRFSGVNISSDVTSKTVIERKLHAANLYITWIKDLTIKNHIILPEQLFLRWLSVQAGSVHSQMSFRDFKKLVTGCGILVNALNLRINYFRAFQKNRILGVLKNKS
ncbi:glycosyltransferase family 2 protein [Sphingobacterium sp. UBA5670]|uniref:glycosyltransferase family 2 protein n=1 Tax=Sphingobacterium sp. UBA5670 TaxID=1947502 RepID=UPI0025D4C335|nr:glycosyltransferase [Sphingobacterium sp. UBA5670]